MNPSHTEIFQNGKYELVCGTLRLRAMTSPLRRELDVKVDEIDVG